jgi:lipopolysaccharide transport system permease protein
VSQTTVIRAGEHDGLGTHLGRLVRHRDLLLLLTQKDLKAKYKSTFLGFLWSMLNPLLLMLVYAAVFSVVVRFQMPRYPVFLLAGVLPWNAFIISISTASLTIVGNGYLIRRVNFPREYLPLASVLSGAVNLCLSLVLLFVFALAFRQPLGAPLLALPLLIVLQTVFTTGLGFFLAALVVYFRDLENLIQIGLAVTFFVTPIIYPFQAVRDAPVAWVLTINPMGWLITGYQRIWHDNQWPEAPPLIAFAALALLALGTGWALFKALEGRFPEEVG